MTTAFPSSRTHLDGQLPQAPPCACWLPETEPGSACTKCNDRMSFGQVVVDAGCVLPVPTNWSTYEAAGFMEATLTAYLNIFQIGGAAKGKSVLVHGGGSGIGT